ncbi:hypothetical protein QR680_016326 [Steinernema hermaphroditum]|uniref:G-protein coupled receptors family 1 profile domain-containing protein n=1 Tax=Steinernema hermaphroditum TaxID=289476 RepID=A0AA39LMG2_9BILA|nr:hypothetical protein QR680_016326 [Steinernema hermaphroditum]
MVEFNTYIAAYIILSIGLSGLAINIAVARAVRKSTLFGYAFGALCFSQAVADIGICGTFVTFVAGITVMEPSWHTTYFGRRSGQLLIFFWEGSIWTHLFAAVNRSAAINLPIQYSQTFDKPKTTRFLMAFIWFVATMQAVPYFIPSCSMTFDPVSFTYAYGEGLCGEITEDYADKITSIIVVATIATLDITTFLRLLQRKMNKSSNTNEHSHKRRELRFFFQACAQSSVLMGGLIFFFYIVYLNLESPWYVFGTTTVVWLSVHVLDGIIVIIFNREVRNIIRGKHKVIIGSSQSNNHSSLAMNASQVAPHEDKHHE